jgi:DNA-binding LytR/AlgR family response regulator
MNTQVKRSRNKQNVTDEKDPDNSNDLANQEQDYFFIKENYILTKVPIRDILWIEALGSYITIHIKSQRFILHATLKSVEKKLPVNKFFRIHRSFIVNIDNIRTVEDTTVYINEIHIPIGALYKRNFIKHLNTL